MSEDQMIGMLFVIFIVGVGSILFKLYILDKIKCRKLFDSLKFEGFYQVDLQEQDVINELNKYKIAQGKEHSTDTFQYVIAQKKESAHKRYLCDVYRRISNHKGGNQHKYYNILIEKLSLPLNFEIIIRPKLSPMIEAMMRMHSSKNSEDIAPITEGLTEDFKLRFAVVSKNGSEACLSKILQDTLLQSIDSYPFNKLKGSVTPVVHISSDGFGLISNRVTKKKDLDSLLFLAEKLTLSLT